MMLFFSGLVYKQILTLYLVLHIIEPIGKCSYNCVGVLVWMSVCLYACHKKIVFVMCACIVKYLR